MLFAFEKCWNYQNGGPVYTAKKEILERSHSMDKSMKTIDGNAAAAHVAYAMSDVATIYPIPGISMRKMVSS